MFTILPWPCSMKRFPAAWQQKKRAFRLASMVASQSASVTSSAGPVICTPAQLTRMSRPPRALGRAVEEGRDPGGLGEVVLEGEAGAAGAPRSRFDDVVERVVRAADDRHIRARPGEPEGDGAADPAATSGDDGRAAGQDRIGHCLPPRVAGGRRGMIAYVCAAPVAARRVRRRPDDRVRRRLGRRASRFPASVRRRPRPGPAICSACRRSARVPAAAPAAAPSRSVRSARC